MDELLKYFGEQSVLKYFWKYQDLPIFTSALVVDSGSTHTSAIPVHDGYVLQHAIVKSPLGADFLTGQCQQFLQDSGLEIVPPYMIKEKTINKQ